MRTDYSSSRGPVRFQQSVLSGTVFTCLLVLLATHSATARAYQTSKVLGDYVPCLFNDDEQHAFRDKATLVTEEEAFALKQKVLGSAPDAAVDIAKVSNKTHGTAYAYLMDQVNHTNASVTAKTQIEQYLMQYSPVSMRPNLWPSDVSCSVSFLQWQETSDVFGRRVANQFVALQVNLRNLSPTSEFLVHDIQVAVDTQAPTSTFSRFQSARDKLIVRAVAQRGQTEDRRNLILSTLTMLGSIAGGANAALQASQADTATATNFSTAVAIFQGSFITGFANIFPDHTLEHINHINDMTFSASSSSKTIVPVQGSVPLVTFISERPLEQLPFAHCGTTYNAFRHRKPNHYGTSTAPRDPYCELSQLAGAFSGDYNVYSSPAVPNLSPDELYVKPLHYKNWQAAALRLLEGRTYVVVGGVHIEEKTSTPTISRVDCPDFTDGSINTAAASEGSLACTVVGANLDKVTGLSIKNDDRTIAAVLVPGKDNASGVIQFKLSDIQSAAGTFSVLLSSAAASNSPTGLTLNFITRKPSVTSVTPQGQVNLSTLSLSQDLILILGGLNLDQLGSVALVSGDTKIVATLSAVTSVTTEGNDINQTAKATFAHTHFGAGPWALQATDLAQKDVSMTPASVTFVAATPVQQPAPGGPPTAP